MNDLRKATLTTLEVAEMMEVPHSDLLQKLDGRQDRKGYIHILGEGHMSVSDYFVKTTYRTEQNKELPCYEVTRLGCDFLANKSTGDKGVLFTARYVRRFLEMENQAKQIPLTEHPGEVANLIKVITNRMDKQGSAPYKSVEVLLVICEQYGIQLPPDIIKVPEYEQLTFQGMREG